MATCEICGNKYLTRECLNCKENKPTEKEKLFKTIRYILVGFFIVLLISWIREIYYENMLIDEIKPYNEMMKKNLKNINKINEKLFNLN